MGFFNRLKGFFKKKEPEKGLIIEKGLPDIPSRVPLVSSGLSITKEPTVNQDETSKILKSCSVCKLAIHDENLTDLRSIICTLNPNKPVIKESEDTCSSHEPKYKNLKVIVDKGTLLEYDSEKTFSAGVELKNKDITNIGEEEWQQ